MPSVTASIRGEDERTFSRSDEYPDSTHENPSLETTLSGRATAGGERAIASGSNVITRKHFGINRPGEIQIGHDAIQPAPELCVLGDACLRVLYLCWSGITQKKFTTRRIAKLHHHDHFCEASAIS